MNFFRILFFSSFVFFLLFVSSCRSDKSSEYIQGLSTEMLDILDTIPAEPKEIFYHMSLPVEMAHLFEQVGANYFPDILNSPGNLSRYNTSLKLAMNLGVYGVDLSYVKMFGRQQNTVNYINAIQRLSDDLGMPKEIYSDVLTNLESYVSNKDSLARVSVDIYRSVDHYLRKSGENSAAAMVMMGGWVEGMYIATQIFERDQGNIKLLDKIAEQKYSLNSLISLMNNYHGEEELTEYLLMLKNIRRSFDKFQIYYVADDVAVDTVNKIISASKYYIDVEPEQILEISTKLASLRNKII